MRYSGVVTYYLSNLPVDEFGQLLPGLVQVTDEDLPLPPDEQFLEPRHVYLSQPGMGPEDLPGTPAYIAIIGVPWTVQMLAAANPNAAKYTLNVEWEEDIEVDGEIVTVRKRAKEAKAPEGVVFTRTNIPLHRFVGED